jgi:AraC family transcriptional regulator of adaptative response/methylated-DNA-[protein]-cysteine methyltransferase
MNDTDTRNDVAEQTDETARWRATERRDTRFDGVFVYAVRSTGIYCRPSCPSRRPRREQVLFFDDCAGAETAGFRPCRRCRPGETPREITMVEAANRYIDEHIDETVTLAALGGACAMSPYHLQRTFKRVTGLTPRQYIRERRMERLKARLRGGADVTTAMYDAGYGSSSRLYEGGVRRLGMTPRTYRNGGVGLEIRYSIVDCGLGRLLVGATERGVCAVSLGDSDEELEQALRREYPAAGLVRDESAAGDWVEAIVAFTLGQDLPPDLPVDIQATAFQWKVWSYLCTIPTGETRSYAEVARAIEQPAAARAVAHACASNPVALVVPCHRVVHADGEVGGYRWGKERKEQLLARERGQSQAGS